jgi:hypothetical protein
VANSKLDSRPLRLVDWILGAIAILLGAEALAVAGDPGRPGPLVGLLSLLPIVLVGIPVLLVVIWRKIKARRQPPKHKGKGFQRKRT